MAISQAVYWQVWKAYTRVRYTIRCISIFLSGGFGDDGLCTITIMVPKTIDRARPARFGDI